MANSIDEIFLQREDVWNALFDSLPGGEMIRKGYLELMERKITQSSLLLLIGARRLRNAGLAIPFIEGNHEHSLYDLLSQHDSDSAHSRYNALIRTLVSFERAAECVPARRSAFKKTVMYTIQSDIKKFIFEKIVSARRREKIDKPRLEKFLHVKEMLQRKLIEPNRLQELFEAIFHLLYRFPAISPEAFRRNLDLILSGKV